MKHQNSIPVLLLKHARWVVIALLFLVSMCVSGKYTQEIFVAALLMGGPWLLLELKLWLL